MTTHSPALRLIVRAVEDAERLGFDVEAAVRVVVARRRPENRLMPLEELYADKLFELNMEREGSLEALFPTGEKA